MKKLHHCVEFAAKILACVLLTVPAFTQNLDTIERELVAAYAPIYSYYGENHDSLEYHSARFDQKINTYLTKYPATFKHPFTQLKRDFFIADAANGLLRIYSWDGWGELRTISGPLPSFSLVVVFFWIKWEAWGFTRKYIR